MSDQLHKPGNWMKVFRRIRFTGTRDGVRGATIKAVGTMLASYANYKTGDEIHPGTARLAVDCEINYRTAKRCLAILRDLGLIVLVRKAERHGLADEYRLDLPEDLLDREEIEVWNPDRYEQEIDRLREKHRGRYVRKDPAERNLRGTQGTAEVDGSGHDPEQSAVPAGDRRIESAGHVTTNLRCPPYPPTYQSTYQGFDQPSPVEDLSGPVAVPGDEDLIPIEISAPIDLSSRRRCVHNRSARRHKNGTLRCPDCRALEEAGICSHGVDPRKFRCPACNRGLIAPSELETP